MKLTKHPLLLLALSFVLLHACNRSTTEQAANTAQWNYELVNDMNAILTETILQDGFPPPVASRIYAYANIAAYEAVAVNDNKQQSLSGRVNDYHPDYSQLKLENTVPAIMALKAFVELGRETCYRDYILEDYLKVKIDSLSAFYDQEVIDNSLVAGNIVAEQVIAWSRKDGYKETRNKPLYTPKGEPGTWEPTPPTYGEAIEPYWHTHRTFMLDSASQFRVWFPVEFDTSKNSEFHKYAYEVYDSVNIVDSPRLEIAKFWDCNPQLTKNQGHLMYKVRQITPGGHWIGITSIASRMKNLSLEEAAYIHTLVSIALADGFITAWDSKYAVDLIRPETYINRYIDKEWRPLLETPLFPEYTSAHSVISAASATVLEEYFGKEFAFIDDTEDPYGLPPRSFGSFMEAAKEAALSRVYGGIHYLPAAKNGTTQGKQVGGVLKEKLEITPYQEKLATN